MTTALIIVAVVWLWLGIAGVIFQSDPGSEDDWPVILIAIPVLLAIMPLFAVGVIWRHRPTLSFKLRETNE